MPINTQYEKQYSNNPATSKLFARGTGAGAASLTGVKGVLSIVWVSTGKYTVNLPRRYRGLLGCRGDIISAGGTTLSVVFPSAEAVLASGTITIEVFGGVTAVALARRDLTSVDVLLLEITLEDSNVRPAGY